MRLLPLPAAGEDVAVDPSGRAYAGCSDGSLWRVTLDGARDRIAGTGGRPLGVEVLDDDRLVVCDAERGLLAVHRDTGAVEQLATHAAGQRLRFCNNASVAADGSVWFSDSSAVHGLDGWQTEMIEVTGTGRLLRRPPQGEVEEWVTALDFANGVAVAPDQGSVLVAECGSRRIRRLWTTGERAGHDDIVVDGLPGYPDNLAIGSDGLLWVALAAPRVRVLERLRRMPPGVRRAAAHKLPDALRPAPRPTVHVQAYAVSPTEVTLVHDLRPRPDGFSMVTGVREHQGRVWLASLRHAALAVLDGPAPPTA